MTHRRRVCDAIALHPITFMPAAACAALSQPGCRAALVALFLGVPGLFDCLLSVMVWFVVWLMQKQAHPLPSVTATWCLLLGVELALQGWDPLLGLFSGQLFKEQP
jgi:hypothetical protein